MTVAQHAIPTGAVAVQFTEDEAAALVEAAFRAAAAKVTEVVRLGLRPHGALATEAHGLAAAVRTPDSLGVVGRPGDPRPPRPDTREIRLMPV